MCKCHNRSICIALTLESSTCQRTASLIDQLHQSITLAVKTGQCSPPRAFTCSPANTSLMRLRCHGRPKLALLPQHSQQTHAPEPRRQQQRCVLGWIKQHFAACDTATRRHHAHWPVPPEALQAQRHRVAVSAKRARTYAQRRQDDSSKQLCRTQGCLLFSQTLSNALEGTAPSYHCHCSLRAHTDAPKHMYLASGYAARLAACSSASSS